MSKLNLVIPCHNEADNLTPLWEEIKTALKEKDFEAIFVNDGSTDKTDQVLCDLAKKYGNIKVITLMRNFGQTAALAAGIDAAKEEIIITLDADRQNDPRDIPRLLKFFDAKIDIISGWRKSRQDPILRSMMSKIANKLINWLTGTQLHDSGCSLKIYRKECFKNLNLYGEMHRFIPSILAQQGYKIRELAVNHRPRVKDKSHYGFARILKVTLDLVVIKFMASFSTKPIYIFGGWGIGLLGLGFTSGIFVLYRKIWLSGEWLSPLLFITILLITIGFLFIFMGLIAEMITRFGFTLSQQKPYRIRSKINN